MSQDGARAFVWCKFNQVVHRPLCGRRMDVNIASHRPCVHMPDGRGVGSKCVKYAPKQSIA